MARLRNANTGAVVNVSDVTAGRLGVEWEPFKEGSKAPVKRRAQRGRRKAAAEDLDPDEE